MNLLYKSPIKNQSMKIERMIGTLMTQHSNIHVSCFSRLNGRPHSHDVMITAVKIIRLMKCSVKDIISITRFRSSFNGGFVRTSVHP